MPMRRVIAGRNGFTAIAALPAGGRADAGTMARPSPRAKFGACIVTRLLFTILCSKLLRRPPAEVRAAALD